MSTTPSPSKARPRWRSCLWVLAIPLLLILTAVLILAVLPVEADADIPEDEWGVGAINITPAWTGLNRQWPEADTDFDPTLANLGYQLFFDPVLSGENNYSCAHCHHPDLGFGDGQAVSRAPNGERLTRNAPSLWNVVYQESFFWDGRAATLEEQLIEALTAEMEMNQELDELLDELAAIEAYQAAFSAHFSDGITVDNIAAAIVAFEKTLVSDGAAFDAYAQGDMQALTSQQRRGLDIFRSAATRCFECHAPPTFATSDFKVIGVPDGGVDDSGRGAQGGVDAAFKVPTLRNVVLTAPYMHNGAFETLPEVIEFYSNGAGRGLDFEGEVDRHVAAGFSLSPQEQEDLIAFLYALTDSTIPERYHEGLTYIDEDGQVVIPDSVPSGLDELVTPLDIPLDVPVGALPAAPVEPAECQRDDEARTVTVIEGQSIQDAVDCAQSGDTVLVPPGVYHERVSIDMSDITLRGLVEAEPDMCPIRTPEGLWPAGEAAPNWPVLDGDIDSDGTKDLTDGVIASGNNFYMEYFIVRNYTGNGVLVEGVRGVTLRHIFTADTGLYGVYPVRSNDVLVECNVSTLATDAGIYVGQSRDIVVRYNLAYDGVTGIEIENSVNADVYENETWNNTGGILIFLLPNLHSRVSHDIRVYDNYVHHNNRPKGDATPGSIVGKVPIGSGIFVMATDHTEIYNNRIEGNNSFGVAVVSLYQAYEPEEIGDVGPLSENNHLHNNIYTGNGTDPDPSVTEAGLSGADILWDARGYGNVFDEPGASTFPPLLMHPDWPGVLNRALFQVWNILGKNL